jgi:hypothetical protein
MFVLARVMVSISIATGSLITLFQPGSRLETQQAPIVSNSYSAVAIQSVRVSQNTLVPDTAIIPISVRTAELVSLFQSDPSLGKYGEPFVANSFCAIGECTGIDSNNAGLTNAFVLDSNTVYTFTLTGTGDCFSRCDSSRIEISMIRESVPQENEWNEIFVTNSSITFNDNIMNVPSQSVNDSTLKFTFKTQPSGISGYNLDYSIIFQINNLESLPQPHYGRIDPLIINTSDEEPD